MSDQRCIFCGERHPRGPVGIPGGAFAGIEFKVCPGIPPDHIYEDREYESGPRGAMHRLGHEPGGAAWPVPSVPSEAPEN